MNCVVEVSGLSKTYRLFHGPRALFKELFLGRKTHHPLDALKDVSFQVYAGEAFGIIGNNGAGKSTLLKILTGTAYPAEGRASVSGRIGALLELGAGFHPEFSGRKNIYFSGAVMGLDPEEIREREEQIIEFSELREFIDKPVKTYSSGMYLRLGFSIATGFNSTILIIDEALSVGDQRFQKKCTDRILEYKDAGNTILFCSHNLHHIRTLCERAIWLHRGSVMAYGSSRDTCTQYENFIRGQEREDSPADSPAPSQVCWVEGAVLTDNTGTPVDRFQSGDTIRLEVTARFTEGFEGTPALGIYLCRNDEVVLYSTGTAFDGIELSRLDGDRYRAVIVFPRCPLLPGRYFFNLCTTDQRNLQAYHIVQNAAPFTVSDAGPDFGVVRLEHRWE